jgi:hypothetical protein
MVRVQNVALIEYINNWSLIGELRVMFAQDDAYSGYMDKFFAANPNPDISWIHEISKQRYGDASLSLLNEAQNVGDLETKHVHTLLYALEATH